MKTASRYKVCPTCVFVKANACKTTVTVPLLKQATNEYHLSLLSHLSAANFRSDITNSFPIDLNTNTLAKKSLLSEFRQLSSTVAHACARTTKKKMSPAFGCQKHESLNTISNNNIKYNF